ncbi:MAG: YIP1 family protein [Chloroflexi bacterium]|nr:YIP1 family protein [Chloroflexota bacterium]
MLLDRMIRAMRLDVNLYEEVEADLNATSQAATVVGIVAIASGIGSAVTAAMGESAGTAVLALVVSIVGAFIGWVLWAYIVYWIGTSIFKGNATPGEMLRTIGFAQSPGVFNILSFIPFLGGIISIIAGIWALVAGIIAIRQGLDISTGQAVITAIIGIIPLAILMCLVGLIIGGGRAALGTL